MLNWIPPWLKKFPLHKAALTGDIETVNTLLDAGANKNEKVYNKTPLHLAAENGCTDIVRLLLDAGANINGTLWPGCKETSPLHLAAESGHIEVVKLLLELGAEYDEEDDFERTPIFYAAVNGHIDIVKLMMEFDEDLDLDIYDREYMTPLHYAAKNGYMELLEIILSCVDDKNPTNDAGLTPLHHAVQNWQLDVVEILIKAGVDLDVQCDKKGNTALHYAAYHHSTSGIFNLLKYKVDNKLENMKGETANDIIRANNSYHDI